MGEQPQAHVPYTVSDVSPAQHTPTPFFSHSVANGRCSIAGSLTLLYAMPRDTVLSRAFPASYDRERVLTSQHRVKDTGEQGSLRLNHVKAGDWLFWNVPGKATYHLLGPGCSGAPSTVRPDKQTVYVHPPDLPTSGTMWHGATSTSPNQALRHHSTAVNPHRPDTALVMGYIDNLLWVPSKIRQPKTGGLQRFFPATT